MDRHAFSNIREFMQNFEELSPPARFASEGVAQERFDFTTEGVDRRLYTC